VVRNNTLRFVRSNWRPTKRDDLQLFFGYENMSQWIEENWPYVHVYPFHRALTQSDLNGKSPFQLQLIRNAIYARHGRPFKNPKLAEYFKSRPWYRADHNWRDGASDKRLTPQEKRNADFITAFEKRR
jgi:hypothetical protein